MQHEAIIRELRGMGPFDPRESSTLTKRRARLFRELGFEQTSPRSEHIQAFWARYPKKRASRRTITRPLPPVLILTEGRRAEITRELRSIGPFDARESTTLTWRRADLFRQLGFKDTAPRFPEVSAFWRAQPTPVVWNESGDPGSAD